MAVTARVWQEAHDFHLQQQRLHALFNHGPGIVTGLEVMGSDPADSSVYILPGIAIDSAGQTIVLVEPMAYDLGSAQGLLYLLLTHDESEPRADDGNDGAQFVYVHFGLEAVSKLPDTPYVELARVQRQSRKAAIVDAKEAAQPAENEIDLRFRQYVGAPLQETLIVAVSYAGGPGSRRHGRAAGNLARSLRQSGGRVWVDDGVPLSAGLETYTLVYLVAQDAFELSRDEMTALYEYVQGGGTLFIESCRQKVTDAAPPGDASFSDLLASMGISLEELPADHSLLTAPYLFAAPPPGFETGSAAQLLVGDGVVFSTSDYGCLWLGERRDGVASREEIRAAMEWGSNIVAYAAARRNKMGGGSRSE
jgi:hypothetical protein